MTLRPLTNTLRFILFFALLIEHPAAAAVDQHQLATAIVKGRANIMAQQIHGNHWNMPSSLGSMFISEYVLFTRWIGKSDSLVNEAILRNILLKQQLSDGSWHQVRDASIETGDLNATIFNYWALKVMGEEPSSESLLKARDYIRNRGGLAKAPTLTRIFLAMFGNDSWSRLPSVPFFGVFSEWSPIPATEGFAQWVSPHIMPYAYLRRMQVTKDLGETFSLDELWVGAKPEITRLGFLSDSIHARLPDTAWLIQKLLLTQRPKGTWGAYTVASLFSIAALDDYKRRFPDWKPDQIDTATKKAFQAIERLYVNSGSGAYQGVLDDGKLWDTALLGLASYESGTPRESLLETGSLLETFQVPSGGMPFGDDFEYAPDTDDTAETIIFWRRLGFAAAADRATTWLISMQNDDGGWGAFAKNNRSNMLLETLAGAFGDSADLFDESEPDTTGHILEALGESGHNVVNSQPARLGADYLRKTQDHEVGGWLGRWGIGYIYGTSAAVVGLNRIGINSDDPAIIEALDWLVAIQNPDGGFGESSKVYDNKQLAGRGVSTPTQTAWAILALMVAPNKYAIELEKAVNYLIVDMQTNSKWLDTSCVGTGHPKLLYMNYPSYPYAWPLMALARYERFTNERHATRRTQ